MHSWIDKDTEIYCSFAEKAGDTGCQMMNTAFYYHGLNKIYKSFSVRSIEDAVKSVLTLGIKGFAITMPYKVEVLKYVHDMEDSVKKIGAANTVIPKVILLSTPMVVYTHIIQMHTLLRNSCPIMIIENHWLY